MMLSGLSRAYWPFVYLGEICAQNPLPTFSVGAFVFLLLSKVLQKCWIQIPYQIHDLQINTV